jgi:predicted DNA-binding transcriptional regulator YafY
LVKALVNENNQLLGRVRQRAQQNHLLLSRSVEMMQRFINAFCAVGVPTYTEAGTMTHPAAQGRLLYEAVG